MKSLVLSAAVLAAKVLPQGARGRLYRMGPVSEALRSLLTRSAPEGLVEVEIAAGPLAGLKMELDLRAEKDLWLGTYEPALLQAIQKWAKPGMVAYDVGANIGYVSLAFARAVGLEGQVVAFEPLPANVSRLRTNIELNPSGGRVRVVGAAVGDRTGKSQLLIHRSGAMGKLEASKGRAEAYQGEISVEVIALDHWIQERNEPVPDLVKIDVEGGEALVLAGFARTLKEARPMLFIELHGPEAAQGTLEVLESARYRLHEMRAGYPRLTGATDWKIYVLASPQESEWR